MTVPAEVERLIAGARLSAHVATSVNDRPHVAPVWYVYDDGRLSFFTGGKKLENIRRNPKVALSIERYDERGVSWGVQLLGTALIVDDDARVTDIRRALSKKYDEPYGSDGGEASSSGLVTVTIGSASSQVYS